MGRLESAPRRNCWLLPQDPKRFAPQPIVTGALAAPCWDPATEATRASFTSADDLPFAQPSVGAVDWFLRAPRVSEGHETRKPKVSN
jgi:hypothetical protein